MKLLEILVFLSIFFLFSITLLHNFIGGKAYSEQITITLSTDKQIYHPRDPIFLNVLIQSPNEYPNVKLEIGGIRNSRGIVFFMKDETINLSAGLNNLTFSSVVPSCSSCTGIYPGKYSITAKLILDNQTIEKTVSIEITS